MRGTQPMPRQTVDHAEVDKFSRLAARWWDPEGPMKPLHAMNPIRLRYLKRVIARRLGLDEGAMRPFDGLRALDIGCGAGLVSEPLTRLGFAMIGLDPSPEMIAAAQHHAQASDLAIDYRAGTIEPGGRGRAGTPPLAGLAGHFEVVMALEVVEHVPDVPAFIAAAAAYVRPGGLLIASTINRNIVAFGAAIIGAEYVLRWLPPGTHSYSKFVRPDELSDAFGTAGLAEIDRTGLVFDPIRREFRLSDDLAVNYFMSAARP